IVARQRRFVGEVHAGQLHAVTRVARKSDDDLVPLFDSLQPAGPRRRGGGAVWLHSALRSFLNRIHTGAAHRAADPLVEIYRRCWANSTERLAAARPRARGAALLGGALRDD